MSEYLTLIFILLREVAIITEYITFYFNSNRFAIFTVFCIVRLQCEPISIQYIIFFFFEFTC